MASIVIKDLAESAEVDRKAMAAIIGGSSNIRSGQSTSGFFQGRGRPIELSATQTVVLNERVKHSKNLKT